MANPHPAYRSPPNQSPTSLNESNALGTSGFVVALLGLLTCGLLSIFGLGLSLFGLRKNPKGLAIAGTIMGVIGLVELVLVGYMMYNTVQAFGVIQAAVYEGINENIGERIANDIATEWERTGQLPSQAEGQAFAKARTDIYENEFRYEIDGSNFTIRGPGQDQEFATDDDTIVGPFSSPQEVFDLVAESELEDEFEDGELEPGLENFEPFNEINDRENTE